MPGWWEMAPRQREGEKDDAEGEHRYPDEEGRQEDSEGGEGEVEGEVPRSARERRGTQAEEEAQYPDLKRYTDKADKSVSAAVAGRVEEIVRSAQRHLADADADAHGAGEAGFGLHTQDQTWPGVEKTGPGISTLARIFAVERRIERATMSWSPPPARRWMNRLRPKGRRRVLPG